MTYKLTYYNSKETRREKKRITTNMSKYIKHGYETRG